MITYHPFIPLSNGNPYRYQTIARGGELAETQSNRLQYRLIAGSYWVGTFGEGVARILLPLYFLSRGIAATEIGLVFFCYELAGLVTNLLGGLVINRFGYRRIFLLALTLQMLASFGYLFLEFNASNTVVVTLVALLRIFTGIGKEVTKISSSASVKHFNQTKVARVKSAQNLLGGKDMIKGSGILLGGILLTAIGFALPFVLFGLIMAALLILAAKKMEDVKEASKVRIHEIYKVKLELHLLAWARAFLHVGRDIWIVIAVPVFLADLGYLSEHIGLLLAAALILNGMTQVLFSTLIKSTVSIRTSSLKKRWPFRKTLLATAWTAAAIPALLGFFPNQPDLLLMAVVLFAIAIGAATSPHNYLQIKYSRKKTLASDLAWYKTVAHSGKMVAVLLSGYLYSHYGLTGCLYLASFSLIVSGGLAYGASRRVQKFKIQKRLQALEPKQSNGLDQIA